MTRLRIKHSLPASQAHAVTGLLVREPDAFSILLLSWQHPHPSYKSGRTLRNFLGLKYGAY